jgi:hypothetical protein
MLDTWFESDPIKAVLGFDAVVGNPAYMLLHHALGELNGRPGVRGYAIGGMGRSRRRWRASRPNMASASTYSRRSGKSSLKAAVPKAAIAERDRHVRFVPKADICNAAIDAVLRTGIA